MRLPAALASANARDTLAILFEGHGGCTFEISHSLTLKGLGVATLDGQAAVLLWPPR